MLRLADFFFFLPFWGKVSKWKGLMSGGRTGVVLDCLGPVSSAVRQPWCSFERATWQRCLLRCWTGVGAGRWGWSWQRGQLGASGWG